MDCVWTSLVFTFSLIVLAMPSAGFAENSRGSAVPIQFAVLLEDGDPVQGEVVCMPGKSCLLVDRKNPGLKIALKLNQRPELGRELTIDCEPSCSFENGHSTMTFSSERQFNFFDGQNGYEVQLVLKARKKLGEVLLILPDSPQKVDHPQL